MIQDITLDLALVSSTVKIPVEKGAAAHLLRGRQRGVAKCALPTRTATVRLALAVVVARQQDLTQRRFQTVSAMLGGFSTGRHALFAPGDGRR